MRSEREITRRELVDQAVARLRSRVMASVCAMVGGAGMFLATIVHIPRRAPRSTLDIGLLHNYLPGYSVSWTGALLGLVYGAATGAVVGGAMAWLYNRAAGGRG